MGLIGLLVSNLAIGSDLYTSQLVLSTKTDALTIKFPLPGLDTGMPVGPNDATVIDNKFVVLDTYGSGVSFFDFNGTLLKRVSLPEDIQFQNIVRDRDNSVYVFGTDSARTKVVHIQDESIVEQTVYKTTRHYIDYIIPDDYGLVMKGTEIPPIRSNDNSSDEGLNEVSIPFLDRIDRNCLSCEPKPAKGLHIGGLLYRITTGKNPSFFIGKKEIPLKLNLKFGMNSYEIIQVDQNGTSWIENLVMFDNDSITYVWKVNKFGEVLGIYRFASDKEISSTEWLMKHQVIVSNDGKVYGLISNKKQFKLVLLKSLSVEEMKLRANKLDSVLFKKKEFRSKQIQDSSMFKSIELPIVGCKLRKKSIDDAYVYFDNKIYLSTSSIVNDATCLNRIIPPYILEDKINKGKAGTYKSVSYNWGGFDTVAEFNNKILTKKMKAGNVNVKNPALLSCTAGVDCSGFVSRAWGLTSKLATGDMANTKITEEIGWYEVKAGDVYLNPGVHVAMYRMNDDFLGNKVVIIESNSAAGSVIEQKVPIAWLQKYNLLPRRVSSSILCK